MNYSILVTTSDHYLSLVDGFLKLLKVHWCGVFPDIIVVGETKSLPVNEILCGSRFILAGKSNWSQQVFLGLKELHTEYVILMMEDCFVTDFIDKTQIDKISEYADLNRMDCLNLRNSSETTVLKFHLFNSVIRPYYTSAAFGFWRKEFLLEFLRTNETAWDFESMGSYRAKVIRPRMGLVFGTGLFKVIQDGAVAKGKLNPNLDLLELHSKFGIIVNWNDIDVTKLVTTEEVPRYVRAYRKILRAQKMIINIYFNKFKNGN